MTLNHDEGWTIPPDSPFYPPLPAIYRNVKMHFVFFYTSPAAVARFLPAPLRASEDGLCIVYGIDIPFSTHYGVVQESCLTLKCEWGSQEGYYCSHVFHNGPIGIAAGREIYGTPKVYSDVKVTQFERTMLTDTLFQGIRILRISSTMEESINAADAPSVLSLTPAWQLKVIPKADGPGPAIKQLIDTSRVFQDVTLHFCARGSGRVTFETAPGYDLTPLTPSRYGEAFYTETSYSEGYAEVAYDYLKPTDPAPNSGKLPG